MVVAAVATPVWTAAPFYSLHQNVLGAALAPQAYWFPEETYDYGLREATAAIARAAAPGAVVVTDAPAVAAHYLARAGRADVTVRSLSGTGVPRAAEAWIVVQREHTTFENALVVAQLRQAHAPWLRLHADRAVAVEVFRLTSG